MHTYLLKGKDPEGIVRSVRVEAESGSAAKTKLEAEGWSDLVLLTHELMDVATKGLEPPFGQRPEVTADQHAAFFENKGDSIKKQVEKSFRGMWVFLFLFACVVVYGIYLGESGVISLGSSVLGLLLLLPLTIAMFGLPLHYYARLNKAKVWDRWDEVMVCVRRLEILARIHPIGPGKFELTRCRAQALAVSGRLEEGLGLFRKFENSPKIPRWFYLSQLSTIYNSARLFEKAIETYTLVLAEKPDSSIHWLDMSTTLSRHLHRPIEARAALEKVNPQDLPQMAQPPVTIAHALVAWREGRLQEARQFYEQAISDYEAFLHLPLVEGSYWLAKGELSAVLGAIGQREHGTKLFREVEAYLVATKETELLEVCRRNLNLPAQG